MKKTIPSIKVDEQTLSNMEAAMKKLNEKQLVEMSFQDYRRLCYELFSQNVLQEKENMQSIKKLLLRK